MIATRYQALVPFAVVACSSCRQAWAVDLRHTRASCPRCQRPADLDRRRRLWQGDDAREAQAAAGRLRLELTTGDQAPLQQARVDELALPKVPRHDSPVEEAAARARAVTNKSQRADAVALWLTRLQGASSHDDYVGALSRAGLDRVRAEKEIVRMLACDVVYEPRAGYYQALSS